MIALAVVHLECRRYIAIDSDSIDHTIGRLRRASKVNHKRGSLIRRGLSS